MIETSGPPFNAVPFDPQQVARTRVGTLTLTFADGNNARFDYTVTLGSPQVSVTRSKQLTRFLFASPPTRLSLARSAAESSLRAVAPKEPPTGRRSDDAPRPPW